MKSNIIALFIALMALVSCEGFLSINPDDHISDDTVFSDKTLADAAVANIYGRVTWGQNIENSKLYIYLDEACWSNGSPDLTSEFADDFMRVYDYSLIREINILINGFNSEKGNALGNDLKKRLIAELRFLRAWTYFNMAKTLGGMPIIYDKVFEYTAGMDITKLQYERSTEAEIYDYVISECTEAAKDLPVEPSINGGRAVAWTAVALKARAALYAGSIAKYNALMASPISTPNGSVGIPADKAEDYYTTAWDAAQEIILSEKYRLYKQNADKKVNFYEALTVKTGNNEVIWSEDRVYPGKVTMFSANNFPTSHAEEESSTNVTPVLGLVEAYEYINNRDGRLNIYDNAGNQVVYEKAEDLFADKDPRLWGTIIYPGAELKGEPVVFQAGRATPANGKYTYETALAGSTDANGELITSINGPLMSNDGQRNKSGFCIRKYLDLAAKASTRQGSGMWFINFRYSEILLIAAEAGMELGKDGAIGYINEVRERAGISKLSTLTLDDIIKERRVELAFENHRYWDLKRLRKAHEIWDGKETNENAVHYALFPYKIYDPGNENDGKWVFEKVQTHMTAYPRYFQMKNYYNFLDQSWLSNNPKLEKNPYQ